MISADEPFDYPMYIAVPLTKKAEDEGDLFDEPELFHRVRVHWTLAEKIDDSPFASEARRLINADISLGEDPYFDFDEVLVLLDAFKAWEENRTEGDDEAFELTKSMLLEAKSLGRGIIFKF